MTMIVFPSEDEFFACRRLCFGIELWYHQLVDQAFSALLIVLTGFMITCSGSTWHWLKCLSVNFLFGDISFSFSKTN